MSTDLVAIQNNIDSLIESKKNALPISFNKTRFIQNSMCVLESIKDKLDKIEPSSVAKVMLKGAFLGLDFMNKECYPIPYGDTLQFQTDYKGEKKLVKKYSIKPVIEVYAKLIREGDIFSEKIINGKQTIDFTPKPFNDGKILGAFAVVNFEDGTMNYDSMSLKEIELVRDNYSKKDKNGNFSKAWNISFGEMAKKTVLRRLCKNIEIDFESIEQRQSWNDGQDATFEEDNKIIDITPPKSKSEAEPKTEPKQEPESKTDKKNIGEVFSFEIHHGFKIIEKESSNKNTFWCFKSNDVWFRTWHKSVHEALVKANTEKKNVFVNGVVGEYGNEIEEAFCQ